MNTYNFTERERSEHLALLALAWAKELYFDNNNGYGCWRNDDYRPFGNSIGVEKDILEIIGVDWEPEPDACGDSECPQQLIDYAYDLYTNRLGTYIIDAITQKVAT